MVSHQVVDLYPASAVTINGHKPRIVHNVSTSTMVMCCDTCSWLSKSYQGRRRHKVEESWREHAGNIAMGITITHGEVGNGCHCATCAIATRQAENQREAGHG